MEKKNFRGNLLHTKVEKEQNRAFTHDKVFRLRSWFRIMLSAREQWRQYSSFFGNESINQFWF